MSSRERAIVAYSIALTRAPHAMQEADIEHLRSEGLSDREILDLCQVVAYYNFVNRMASGLGVELESYWAGPGK